METPCLQQFSVLVDVADIRLNKQRRRCLLHSLLKAEITGTTVIEPLLSPACRYSRSPLRSDGCHRGKAGEGFSGSVRDYATQLA